MSCEEQYTDKVVYHYTSLQTFVNIIKGQKLYLFDITKSNDPLEGIFAIQALKDACLELAKEDKYQNKLHLMKLACLAFYDYIYSFGRLSHVYTAISLCEYDPKMELALWRAYGDGGKGVAIGFSTETLEHLVTNNNHLQFRPITYLSKKEMLEKAKDFWRGILDDKTFECTERDFDTFSEPIKEKFIEYYENGYFIKHNANEYEKEYRLLCKCADLGDHLLPGIEKPVADNISFMATGNDLKIYYTVDIGEATPTSIPIKQIFLGPLCNATENEIKMLLHKYGIKYAGISHQNDISMR